MTSGLRVLVVDDDAVDRKTIQRVLDKSPQAFEIVDASDAQSAFEALDQDGYFDCILLDYNLPGMDGLQLLSELHGRLGAGVPIVMLTGEGSELIAVDAMKRGACDYLPKALLAADTLPRTVGRAVEDAQLRKQLAEAQALLEYQALYDPLSGLGNRQLFMRDLARAIADGERHGRAFCLLMMDLDKFKAANDTWGHAAGDVVLAEVGRRLAACGRTNDGFYRMGGDEFTALIDAPDENALRPVFQRVFDKLHEPVSYGDVAIPIGVSIGVALYPRDGTTADALLQTADTDMYRAKRSGDRVEKTRYSPS